MQIKIIVGLGNPGNKYQNTRHNIGFIVLDALAEKWDAAFIPEKRSRAETAAFDTPATRVILAKPQVYMNRSGEIALSLKKFFKVKNADILVVHDEIDLPLGKLRLSTNSGAAGHRGVESVIAGIGQNFTRLRIGVENRKAGRIPDTESYVLQNFTPDEEKILADEIIPKALPEIERFLEIKTPRHHHG